MKNIVIPFFAILFLSATVSAQIGIQSDLIVSRGGGMLSRTVPTHAGVTFGMFYTIKQSPVSVGWRTASNFYGSSRYDNLPYYREDYVHQVANISNNHSFSQNIFYIRYELNPGNFIVPFVEAGGGWTTYRTRWQAIDPNQNTDDNCEGYLESKVFFSAQTAAANASAGINLKFNQLNGSECAGVWVTLAVDYARGGQIRHLNSKLNNAQFYYVSGDPATLPAQPRHGGHSHSGGSASTLEAEMPAEQYLAQSVYTAKHELWQLRIGVTWYIGKCLVKK